MTSRTVSASGQHRDRMHIRGPAPLDPAGLRPEIDSGWTDARPLSVPWAPLGPSGMGLKTGVTACV